jgi:hypothetical protein
MSVDDLFHKEPLYNNPWIVGIVCTLIGVVLGTMGGYYVGAYLDDITADLQEMKCRGYTNLTVGKAARKEAVKLEIDTNGHAVGSVAQIIARKHDEANAAFSAAEKCGVEEAKIYLGQAHCFGWGYSTEPIVGWRMIHSAVRKDPKLLIVWLDNRESLCPGKRD